MIFNLEVNISRWKTSLHGRVLVQDRIIASSNILATTFLTKYRPVLSSTEALITNIITFCTQPFVLSKLISFNLAFLTPRVTKSKTPGGEEGPVNGSSGFHCLRAVRQVNTPSAWMWMADLSFQLSRQRHNKYRWEDMSWMWSGEGVKELWHWGKTVRIMENWEERNKARTPPPGRCP